MSNYAIPPGGLPPQTQRLSSSAIFTNAYAVIPAGVMTDIVTSVLPGWDGARAWTLARPLSGFAETFSQMIVELGAGGGSSSPEPAPDAEAVIFVVGGEITLTFDGAQHAMKSGGYAYLPAGKNWEIANPGTKPSTFHWIRKSYEKIDGVSPPQAFVTNEADVPIEYMPDTNQAWGTQRFVSSADVAHDMQVNIVTFQPGGTIPFLETHVMEHGIYVLEGKAVYRLNNDWVEVEAGDFMWLRAFCPQACYASGPENFRYLLYKDINRMPSLQLR